MDPGLIPFIEATTPQLNPRLARGLATEEMLKVESYLNDVFRSVGRDFPEGLEYVSCARCTPEEDYNKAISVNNGKQKSSSKYNFETARTDFYMMKYLFRLHGKDCKPVYMYLPFVAEGGRITISGSDWTISPVLSDRVISVGQKNIFFKVIRDKITLYRQNVFYMTNHRFDSTGDVVQGERESVTMVHGKIYKDPKAKPNLKAVTSLPHYLFCKYGASDVFSRFAQCQPVFAEEFDPQVYPESEWVICSTNQTHGARPRIISNKEDYFPTRIKIAIRKEQYTPMVKALVGGFFYVADIFPQQMLLDYVDSTRQWTILLGNILLSTDINVGILYDKMINHVSSLDEYIDNISRAQLHDIDIDVSDLYEFFALIIEKYNSWIAAGDKNLNTMYGKELQVLYYVLSDITEAIVKFHFRIKASAAKKLLTEKDFESTVRAMLSNKLAYRLIKTHGEVSSNTYSGDNMAFKTTSILVPQSKSTKSRKSRGDRGAIDDPSKKLHPSVAEIGSYSGMPKSSPDGRTKLNHHAMVDARNIVQQNPKFLALLDEVGEMIRHRRKNSAEEA